MLIFIQLIKSLMGKLLKNSEMVSKLHMDSDLKCSLDLNIWFSGWWETCWARNRWCSSQRAFRCSILWSWSLRRYSFQYLQNYSQRIANQGQHWQCWYYLRWRQVPCPTFQVFNSCLIIYFHRFIHFFHLAL